MPPLDEFRADLSVAGEKEVRCWTIPRGCLAPQAAGVIHGDFERGFIKAEVVAYQDFHDLCEGGKSMAPIKAAGKYRQEGKTYVGTQIPPDAAAANCMFPRLSKMETLSTSNSVSYKSTPTLLFLAVLFASIIANSLILDVSNKK